MREKVMLVRIWWLQCLLTCGGSQTVKVRVSNIILGLYYCFPNHELVGKVINNIIQKMGDIYARCFTYKSK